MVKKLGISNKEAKNFIENNRVKINGKVMIENSAIEEEDEISLDEKVIRARKLYTYVIYYKPRGIESTLNAKIENNLRDHLLNKFSTKLFPVGRLDKESEGLMLFTDHGALFNKIIKSEMNLEKEYEVKLEKNISDDELKQLADGIVIMGELTKPAIVKRLNESSFSITLTQGLNRQIRRMCYKLNHEVIQLKRTRIINLKVEDLEPGSYRVITEIELQNLMAETMNSSV